MQTIVILIAIAFAVSRFFVPVSGRINRGDIYKDFAHIFVGVLIGIPLGIAYGGDWRPYALTAVALTIVEVIAFKVRKQKA